MKAIKNPLQILKERKARLEQQWDINQWDGGQINLSFPHRLWKSHSWNTWGEMQAKILSTFRRNWQQTHVYIRFQTHVPNLMEHTLKSCLFERYPTESKHEGLFWIHDCENFDVWKSIFASAGVVHLSRTFYVLDKQPANWHETLDTLFGVARKLSDRYSPSDFEETLSICRCLIYSSDNDMVIGKVDLSDVVLCNILKGIANEYQLEFSMKKDTKQYKKLS